MNERSINLDSTIPSPASPDTGVVVVDHGSRRAESNELLLRIVDELREQTGWANVEPAHMELASPSIADAFARCIERGAERIVVHPYFLAPGRHWRQDIPALAAEASREHGGVPFVVTPPLGPHELLLEVVRQRVEHSLQETKPTAAPPSPASGDS